MESNCQQTQKQMTFKSLPQFTQNGKMKQIQKNPTNMDTQYGFKTSKLKILHLKGCLMYIHSRTHKNHEVFSSIGNQYLFNLELFENQDVSSFSWFICTY